MMKVKIALVLRIALLLTACTSNSIDKSSLSRQMRQAEELVNVNPDSALHILQAMPEEDALPLLLQKSEDVAKTQNYYLGSLYEMAIGTIYSNHYNETKKAWNHTQKAFGYALKTNDSIFIASNYEQITSLMVGEGRNFYKDFASVRNMKENLHLNLNDFPFNPDSVRAFEEIMKQYKQRMSAAYTFDIDSILQFSDLEGTLISKGLGQRETVNIEMDDNTQKPSMDYNLFGLFFLTISILVVILVYKFKMKFLDKNAEIKRYKYQIRENNKLITQNQSQITQLQEKINEQQGVEEEKEESHQAMNEELYNRNLFFTDQIISLVSDFKKLKKSPRTLTEAEIVDLKQNVNQYFDAYIDRLVGMVPSLTEGDLELCALIKLGIPIKDISVILNIDSASVSTRKYRMQKRIIESIGTFDPQKSMDDWLRSL